MTRLSLNTIGIKGHSFRKGAAQHAHEAGLLNEQIQTLGRWSSDAFKLYFSSPPAFLFALNKQFQTGRPLPLSLPAPPLTFYSILSFYLGVARALDKDYNHLT